MERLNYAYYEVRLWRKVHLRKHLKSSNENKKILQIIKPSKTVVHMPEDRQKFDKIYAEETFDAIQHLIGVMKNCPPKSNNSRY